MDRPGHIMCGCHTPTLKGAVPPGFGVSPLFAIMREDLERYTQDVCVDIGPYLDKLFAESIEMKPESERPAPARRGSGHYWMGIDLGDADGTVVRHYFHGTRRGCAEWLEQLRSDFMNLQNKAEGQAAAEASERKALRRLNSVGTEDFRKNVAAILDLVVHGDRDYVIGVYTDAGEYARCNDVRAVKPIAVLLPHTEYTRLVMIEKRMLEAAAIAAR